MRKGDSRGAHGRVAALSLAILLLLIAPAVAIAHAVVYPKRSTPGAYERYVLRVPNEKEVATTRIEIRFPAEARVVSFEEVPGFQLEVLSDSAKRITGAVWTGSLPPQRFVELPFEAVNPKTAMQLVWPAVQTYADGERVEWTGAEGSKNPASTTMVGASEADGAGGGSTRIVTWIALGLAFVSLGLSLRKRAEER